MILRPPLVVGPGAPGNFERLMASLVRGTPLPFGAIHNRRSFVALDNLTDLVATVITHAGARGQTFLVSDGEDISTTELLRRTARALSCRARLVPVPQPVLSALFRLMGRQEFAQRLLQSLQIDMRRTQDLLAWSPPVRLDDALNDAARHFQGKDRNA